MGTAEVERLLEQALKLIPAQKRQLLSVLSGAAEAARVVEVLETRPARCPHCSSELLVRHCLASGLQRYRCRGLWQDLQRADGGAAGAPAPQGQVGAAGSGAARGAERSPVGSRAGRGVQHGVPSAPPLPEVGPGREDQDAAMRGRGQEDQLPEFIQGPACAGAQGPAPWRQRRQAGGLSDEQEPVLVASDRPGAMAEFILERADKASTVDHGPLAACRLPLAFQPQLSNTSFVWLRLVANQDDERRAPFRDSNRGRITS